MMIFQVYYENIWWIRGNPFCVNTQERVYPLHGFKRILKLYGNLCDGKRGDSDISFIFLSDVCDERILFSHGWVYVTFSFPPGYQELEEAK